MATVMNNPATRMKDMASPVEHKSVGRIKQAEKPDAIDDLLCDEKIKARCSMDSEYGPEDKGGSSGWRIPSVSKRWRSHW